VNKTHVWLAGNISPNSHHSLWTDQPALECVGTSDLSCESLKAIETAQPDALVLEIDPHDRRISWVLKRLAQTNSNMHIIAHSQSGEKRFVMRLLRSGVQAFILDAEIKNELAKAVSAVTRGDVFLCSSASGMLVSEYRKHSQQRKSMESSGRTPPRASKGREK
jgi:DNA-binding NarL/FixJ family response regulator